MARTPLSLPVSGAKLRALREERGWEQLQVAERTQIERSRISRIETGDVMPTPQQLRALLDVYGVEVDAVLAAAS